MKFLPTLCPLAVVGLAISLAACSTPSNRRELYNTASANGPWHDYERRLDASAETGVAPGDMGHAAGAPEAAPGNNTGPTTVVRNNHPTPQPKSAPLAPDATTLPSNAPATVPAPENLPASPTAPPSPTSTDPAAPAAPGGATTAPPTDTGTVPVNPPTT